MSSAPSPGGLPAANHDPITPLDQQGSSDRAAEVLALPSVVGRPRAKQLGVPAAAVTPHRQDAAVALEEESCFVPCGFLEERPLLPNQTIVTFEHQGLNCLALSARADFETGLSPAAQVGLAFERSGAPDVVPESSLQQHGAVPCRAVIRPCGEAEVLVQVVVFGLKCARAALPGAGINKEAVPEDEKMRVPRVAVFHREAMDWLPVCSLIAAAQDDDGSCRVHHMAIRTAPKNKVELASKPAQISEGIVLAVVKHPSDRADADLGQRVTGGR